ncbi:MAG: hypothetical protein WBG01_18310, partial [Bacteroidota bacterium]
VLPGCTSDTDPPLGYSVTTGTLSTEKEIFPGTVTTIEIAVHNLIRHTVEFPQISIAERMVAHTASCCI